MKLDYHILFAIELLHEYFKDRKCPSLALVPTDDCLRFIKSAHILWRNTGSTYYALIRENEAQEPFVNLIPDDGSPSEKLYRLYFSATVFRFYLKVTDPVFYNYTNIGLEDAKNRLFYFSNLANNQTNAVFYLSMPIADHQAGKEYLPGDFVAEPGTDNVFEAISKHNSTNIAQLTDTNLWVPKGLRHLPTPLKSFINGKLYEAGDLVLQPATKNVFEAVLKHSSTNVAELSDPLLWKPRGEGQLQYASDADLLEYSGEHYRFVLPAAVTTAQVSFFAYNFNEAAPAFDVPVGATQVQNFTVPQDQVTVILSSLMPGRYLVQVNATTRFIYYDPQLVQGNYLGVVEIFNHLSAANIYSFLAADEKINGILYHIQFALRRVLWKFVRKDSRAQAITDTGTTAYGFALHADDFVSVIPIPLSEEVLETLELQFSTADFKLQSLPNPTVHRLGTFTQNGFNYLCSEVFLNY